MKSIYRVMHLFCGIGGGSLGFSQARGEWKGIVGRFQNVCGIDADPEICRDYERITGSPAACMDLFSREQYVDFHGQDPPVDLKEVTPHDIWMAAGGETPDVIFTSPPCKGFSGLLPEKSAKTKKYQALNRLTIRGIRLCLDAFSDDLPSLFLLENVPRIKTRGKYLLDEIKELLVSRGYAVNDEDHDCGEIGGLAQRRKRYLLIARNENKMPSFVYRPYTQKVKSIGDVLGELPLPGDPFMGEIHRLPKLQWKTWVRLALIPAGGDWRDLEKIEWEKYRIGYEPRKGALGVEDWNEPSRAVTGSAGYGRSNGAQAISDPRTGFKESTHGAIYRVQKWEEAGNTVTGAMRPNNGALCIADPRINCNSRPNLLGVANWEKPISTVTGSASVTSSNAVASISDPRLKCNPRSGTMGVQDWNEPGKTVIGSGDIHAGATAIADPRVPEDTERGVFIIVSEDGTWHRPMTTLELASLQGFPMYLADGTPFELTGSNDARWRERIGNAVPPAAAKAIAEVMLAALMPSQEGIWVMGETEIWVVPQDEEKEVGLVN